MNQEFRITEKFVRMIHSETHYSSSVKYYIVWQNNSEVFEHKRLSECESFIRLKEKGYLSF